MKTFIFDLINRFQRTSESLDAKTVLCNKTWRAFTDTNEKELHIFMEDGTLVISINGNVTMGKWTYVPANHSLVISGNNQHLLVHPVIFNNILTLVQDGTNNCSFLLDDTKAELDRIKSLQNVQDYILSNINSRSYIPNNSTRNISSYIFDDNEKAIWEDVSPDDPNLLFRKSNHTFYYKKGNRYVRYMGHIEVRDGSLVGLLITSSCEDNNRMMFWLSVNGGKDYVGRWYVNCSDFSYVCHSENDYQNTFGIGISKEKFENKFLPRFSSIINQLMNYKIYEG